MEEERQPRDETRKALRVFGVKVTQYEEKTAALLEQARKAGEPEERLRISLEVMALTADLNERLRDMSGHVLETQQHVLEEMRSTLGGA